MKTIAKTLLLLGATILLGIISPAILIADGDDEIIVTKSKGDDNNGGPRSLEIIPIQASYNSSTQLVSVDFTANIGIVDIDIENEDAGTISSYMVNSAISHHSFIISGSTGLWRITFTLIDGTTYFGEWVL